MEKQKLSHKNKLPKNGYYLPPELLREVLARSPVKTLLKFRCVCKSWRSLIDSDDFVSMHRKLYSNNSSSTRLLVVQQRKHDYIFTIRHGDTFRRIGDEIGKFRYTFEILQLCNGLMLIIDHDGIMKLWNLSIRKCLIIPNCPIHTIHEHRYNNIWYVLGFAPSTNDYKVVAIGSQSGSVAIYSLNDHRWRVKSNRINVHDWGISLRNGSLKPIVCSGKGMYWVGRNQNRTEVIFAVDFDAEKFTYMPLPDDVRKSIVWFIFPLGDAIAVFTMSTEKSCIWVVEKHGEEIKQSPWRLRLSTKADLKACKLFELTYKYSTNNINLFFYVQRSNTFIMVKPHLWKTTDKLMSYNLTSQEIKHLGKSLCGRILFDTYVENLVLHKGIEGHTLVSFP